MHEPQHLHCGWCRNRDPAFQHWSCLLLGHHAPASVQKHRHEGLPARNLSKRLLQ